MKIEFHVRTKSEYLVSRRNIRLHTYDGRNITTATKKFKNSSASSLSVHTGCYVSFNPNDSIIIQLSDNLVNCGTILLNPILVETRAISYELVLKMIVPDDMIQDIFTDGMFLGYAKIISNPECAI